MSFKEKIEQIDPEKEGLRVLEQSDIDSIHGALLYMLKRLDSFCSKNDISWTLAGGGILGAVRHHGFIPWDDDADVHMTRKELNKFLEAFRREPMEGFILRCPGDDGYLYHFPKLYLEGSVFRELQSNDENPNCLFIDIFPLENTYDSAARRKLHGLHCNFLALAVSAMRINACKKTLLKYTEHSPEAYKAVEKRCRQSLMFRFRSLTRWLTAADKCFSKAPDDSSEEIVIPSGAKHYFGELYNREQITKRKYVPFEDTMMPVPADAEGILRQRYGEDYMDVPPVEKRARHAIIECSVENVKRKGDDQL